MMAKACPINFQLVNENQIRIQAAFITLTALLFIATGWMILPFFLVYDFAARLFISPKLSLFTQIATALLKLFRVANRPVDSAPKLFASRIGLVFSVVISALVLFELNNAALIAAAILALCAGMEALFNYCVGCKFYTILHHFNII